MRTRIWPAGFSMFLIMHFAGCSNSGSGTADYSDSPARTNASPSTPEWPVEQLNPGKPLVVELDYSTERDQSGAGKFVDLDPIETGIDLQHVWDPPPMHRNLDSQPFGSGVAIGDYDNDGLLDVFVTRQTDAGRLYRNLGAMRFEDTTAKVGIDPSGMWAFGATFVDINNDGRLDLYLCGQDCPNRLYINNGRTFDERAAEFGLDFHGASIQMSFADYDLDGDLDGYLLTNHLKGKLPGKPGDPMVVRRPGQPPEVLPAFRETVYLLKHPDGTFKRINAGQFDRLFRNDNGKFVDVTKESGIGLQPYIGLSANWWDYNADGRPDLYVANDYKGPDFLYRNDGPDANGRFTFTNVIAETVPHTPWSSMGSDFGDINNDGRLDYIATDMAGTNHYRDKLSMGNMGGPGSQAWFLNWPNPPQYMRNAVYLNSGTERFLEVANLAGLAKTDWTWSTRCCDFDNDGWQDVYFTNGMTRDILNGDHADTLRQIEQEYRQAGNQSKPLADIIHEFWLEKEPFRLENMCFQNTGDLKFKDVGKQWGLDHLGVSTGCATADLDNDGDLDIVISGFEERVRVYRNELSTKKSIRFRLVGSDSNRGGVGARVDIHWGGSDANRQTAYVNPTRGFMSSSENIVHFGVGDVEEIDRVVIQWPSGIRQQLAALKTNRLYRVTESAAEQAPPEMPPAPMFRQVENGLQEFRHREVEFDDYLRQPLLPNKYSQLGPGMAWGDIDDDGDDDLFIGGAKSESSRIVENLGDGKFQLMLQSVFDADAQCEDMGAVFFDADGDGDLDLYVVSGGVECEPGDAVLADRLYLNDGKGNFEKSSEWLPDLRESGGPVAACDFDHDGDIDLFVGTRIIPGEWPETPRSVLLINSGGKFDVADEELAPGVAGCGLVTAAIWSDVDNDNWSDLLVAVEWGPIRLFRNHAGKLVEETASAGLAERLGWYNSICGGDIDNDGDIDYVVGNTGLNTKYKATADKPELLYYGDFEGLGRKQIVEAKFENGVCLPRRGLSCSSHAMPMIKDKTPTFHEFAISSLDMLYSAEKLEDASRFEANSLESGILYNESTAAGVRFRFEPLPRIVQVSPVFGSQLCDVNGDGNLDLYVVQNFYGPQRETGYFNGGLSQLLLGDGKGGFVPVDAANSGLVVTGDATCLTLIDFNNNRQPGFLVGRNNSSPLIFENSFDSSASFLIRLNEISDGKSVLNAKVHAKWSDGSQQLFEYRSSDGYLSQSGPVARFANGSGKTLREVSVQWPDGSTTGLPINADGTAISTGTRD